jgi:predicted Zn-dependent protease with MMP-like domain
MAQHNGMKRMSLRRFGRFVAQVMETLPDAIKEHLDNVVVDVEQEPSEELLREAGFTEEEIDAGESLYGLFAPMDLPSGWASDAVDLHDLPHRIFVFKRPLEEDFPDRRELLLEIRKTVIHELAHHFGWTEEDLERFEDNPNPFPDELEEPP